MAKAGFFYHEEFLKHEPNSYHPETPKRVTAILDELKKSGLFEKLQKIQPNKAGQDQILRVHSKSHFERIEKSAGGSGNFDPDTYYSPGSYDAAMLAAGAVVQATEAVTRGDLDSAFCLVRPPGHHAEQDRAMGFCLFNNAAIAAAHARDELGLSRIMIADPDVHHGNGTQHIFEEDSRVLYFSTHQYPFYPGTGHYTEIGKGRGQGFTANCPLPGRMGDPEYLAVYNGIFLPLARAFKPELLIVSAGFDAFTRDPIGGMNVTEQGFGRIAEILLSLGIPTVFSLEGGYDPEGLGKSVTETVRRMLSRSGGKLEIESLASDSSGPDSPISRLVKLFQESMQPYWPNAFKADS
ncbi:MAG: histone deacetylase [Deltaproteobacteria bacterium]|nr:histone deacetylase [Deltaproteobacteria bacterium]